MSDKVQKIKQEIERQIEEGKVKCQQSQENNDQESYIAWSEHVATCGKLLLFINSLLKEPTSEDLGEEIDKEIDNLCELGCYMEDLAKGDSEGAYPLPDNVVKELRKFACHFAEWQKDRDYKMYAHVPLKDIHDAWQELKKNKPDIENYPAVCFQRGVDFQKQKDIEELNKKPRLKGWIARDKTYDLHFFSDKPQRNVEEKRLDWDNIWIGEKLLVLDCNLYPELTWESEPLEIELILSIETL